MEELIKLVGNLLWPRSATPPSPHPLHGHPTSRHPGIEHWHGDTHASARDLFLVCQSSCVLGFTCALVCECAFFKRVYDSPMNPDHEPRGRRPSSLFHLNRYADPASYGPRGRAPLFLVVFVPFSKAPAVGIFAWLSVGAISTKPARGSVSLV